MSYTIKTYQDGFIQPQFEIGSKLYDPWPMGGQTRPAQLETAYSAEDFDPETRFYLFAGETMVGFLTASFRDEKDGKKYFFFEFPYVLEEHQPEGELLLLDHAIKALKTKGADVLVARAGDYWGNSLKYALEYGFEKKNDIARRAEILIDELSEPLGDSSILVDFDPDQHFDALVELYVEQIGASRENVSQRLQRWKTMQIGDTFTSPWDQTLTLLTHKVIVDGQQLTGRLMAMNHSNHSVDSITLNQVIFKEQTKELLGACLQQLVETGREFGKKQVIIHTGLWGTYLEDTPFEPFDLKFSMKLAYFEKEL